MACHLFWAKPSFEPMLIYHELGPLTYTCVQFNWKMLKKSIWWHDVLKNLKLPPHLSGANELTDRGLVKPYGDLELGQHWRHQAITWTSVDSSSARYDNAIQLRAISQELPKP